MPYMALVMRQHLLTVRPTPAYTLNSAMLLCALTFKYHSVLMWRHSYPLRSRVREMSLGGYARRLESEGGLFYCLYRQPRASVAVAR
jgi:hypothetical protein